MRKRNKSNVAFEMVSLYLIFVVMHTNKGSCSFTEMFFSHLHMPGEG